MQVARSFLGEEMTLVTSAGVCPDPVDKIWPSSGGMFLFLQETGAGPKSASNLDLRRVFPVTRQSRYSQVVHVSGNIRLGPIGCG